LHPATYRATATLYTYQETRPAQYLWSPRRKRPSRTKADAMHREMTGTKRHTFTRSASCELWGAVRASRDTLPTALVFGLENCRRLRFPDRSIRTVRCQSSEDRRSGNRDPLRPGGPRPGSTTCSRGSGWQGVQPRYRRPARAWRCWVSSPS
jgi:hypothetical protein